MNSPFILTVDARAVDLALEDYLAHPDEGAGELLRLARLHHVLPLWTDWVGCITTIGAWFTQLVPKEADAFPGLPVSHLCVTPKLVSVLLAAAPVSSLPFLTTWCANVAGSGGCQAEGRAA